MAYSLKNMWAAMAVSLVAATSIVNAAPFFDNNQSYGDSSGCCPCGPVRPCVDPCGNWFVDAEFIYWNVSEHGLEYGTEVAIVRETETTPEIVAGRTHKLGDKWEPGFRVGLGYDLPCDGWDVVAYYTNLYSKSHSHTFTDPTSDDFFNPTYITVDQGTEFDDIHASWKLNLNLLDFELGREFCVSSCVTIRPFIGVRAAWIDQSITTRLFNVTDTTDDFVARSRTKTKFDGAGLRGGLDSEWKLGWCGISIYGQSAASILYGRFKNSYHEFSFESPIDPVGTVVVDNDNYNACVAIADAAIGLRWKEYFNCDTIALTLQVGYETHFFWDQAQFIRPTARDGFARTERFAHDLNTNGVTFAAKLAF